MSRKNPNRRHVKLARHKKRKSRRSRIAAKVESWRRQAEKIADQRERREALRNVQMALTSTGDPSR